MALWDAMTRRPITELLCLGLAVFFPEPVQESLNFGFRVL